MKFDVLDRQMRVFETAHDHAVLPGIWIVARLDGRGFTKLTADLKYAKPFDPSFHAEMMAVVCHLMLNSGFETIYGYTQSDEISLLFKRDTNTFGRQERKFNSVLAGEASAVLSVSLGKPVGFDCRICQLPTDDDVVDYFMWRSEDAARNSLNGNSYWILRNQANMSAEEATLALQGVTAAEKNEMLFRRGLNFNDLPIWEKRGVGVRWKMRQKPGENPMTGEKVVVWRRGLYEDYKLPMKAEYEEYIRTIL